MDIDDDDDDNDAGWILGVCVCIFIKASVWRAPLLVGPRDRLLWEFLSTNDRAVSYDL